MEKTKRLEFLTILYAVGIVLIPAIKVGSKYFFFAEILMIPFVILFFSQKLKSKIRLPKNLVYVWIALTIAFMSGFFRGNAGLNITIYNTMTFQDSFQWSVDLIRYFRWLLIFSTPWIVHEVYGKNKDHYLSLFLRAILICSAISSILSIFDFLGWINLENLYPYSHGPYWEGRSYGTFTAPLEASLVYAVCFSYSLILFLQNISKNRFYLLIAALNVYALVITQSASGMIGALLVLAWFFIQKNSSRVKMYITTLAGICLLVGFALLPRQWFLFKFNNYLSRTMTWSNWFDQFPSHPWFLISGMGFTSLAVDNSFILLVFYGGLVLLTAAILWMKPLLKSTWSTKAAVPFLIVWFFSWLSLDSIGYWGLGKICWFLMGLCLTQKTLQGRNAN